MNDGCGGGVFFFSFFLGGGGGGGYRQSTTTFVCVCDGPSQKCSLFKWDLLE